MPVFDVTAIPAAMMRPVLVAIAHLPIVALVIFMFPMWIWTAVRPQTHGAAALQFLSELRTWSADVVAGSSARPGQNTQ